METFVFLLFLVAFIVFVVNLIHFAIAFYRQKPKMKRHAIVAGSSFLVAVLAIVLAGVFAPPPEPLSEAELAERRAGYEEKRKEAAAAQAEEEKQAAEAKAKEDKALADKKAKEAEEKELAQAKAAEEQAAKEAAEKEKAEEEQAAKEQAAKEAEEAKAKKAAEEKAEAERVAAEKAAADKAEAERIAAEEAAAEEEAIDDEMAEEVMLWVLKDNMGDVVDVTFDAESQTYTLYATDEDFAKALMFVAAGDLPIEQWEQITANIAELSLNISDQLGTGYTIMFANPVNDENIILIAMDGTILYDAISEGGF